MDMNGWCSFYVYFLGTLMTHKERRSDWTMVNLIYAAANSQIREALVMPMVWDMDEREELR